MSPRQRFRLMQVTVAGGTEAAALAKAQSAGEEPVTSPSSEAVVNGINATGNGANLQTSRAAGTLWPPHGGAPTDADSLVNAMDAFTVCPP